MDDFNKYRKILYKKWKENTIMNEDTAVKEVIVEVAFNYYIIIIQKTKWRRIGIKTLPEREYTTLLN